MIPRNAEDGFDGRERNRDSRSSIIPPVQTESTDGTRSASPKLGSRICSSKSSVPPWDSFTSGSLFCFTTRESRRVIVTQDESSIIPAWNCL
jgi:hypothetical protein